MKSATDYHGKEHPVTSEPRLDTMARERVRPLDPPALIAGQR
jgi:hypothetical protein